MAPKKNKKTKTKPKKPNRVATKKVSFKKKAIKNKKLKEKIKKEKLTKRLKKKKIAAKLKIAKLKEKLRKKKISARLKKARLIEKLRKKKIAAKLRRKKQIERLKLAEKIKKEKLEKRRLRKLETEKRRALAIEEKINKLLDDLLIVGKRDGYLTIKQVERIIPKKLRSETKVEEIKKRISSQEISIVAKKEEFITGKDEDGNFNLSDSIEDDKKSQVGKTNDPVRLYLRDMGGVDLLSREGEIAIAKRIEAGREMMIGAICESPLTIRSVISWKDSIKDGTMLLRDIVDLEATYDVSDFGESKIDETLKIIESGSTKEQKLEEKKLKKEKKRKKRK